MSRDTARALATHLPGAHDDHIIGAVWAGYADVPVGPRIFLSGDREYIIVAGSIDEVPGGYQPHAFERIPLRWWPGDHAWCIGNDIYARSVYVGASQDVADAILADSSLEAYPVSPDMTVRAEDL
ncbi:hypothetical protein F6B43_14405 [Microbacterium rhizomatis]|uniref:Uncharacterized protein n=2 Tax=Microbacterium rhizomatis TaxID=1631477 RepID=A0A5J5IYR8_9MICO|nr:hypothetical protein F6B43_14405 [Microbacterium rhizomatis]